MRLLNEIECGIIDKNIKVFLILGIEQSFLILRMEQFSRKRLDSV